jgi:hypothetical protein
MWRLSLSLYLSLAIFASAFSLLSTQYLYTVDEKLVEETRANDLRAWLMTIDALAPYYSDAQWHTLGQDIAAGATFPLALIEPAALASRYSEFVATLQKQPLGQGHHQQRSSLK